MAEVAGDDGATLPLQGIVLCCTSLSPEERSQIADMAVEMGAEHKLDLTSDVTHLIVGELQTPKYKFVAKEREDVQCLLMEWVYAIREQFLSGDKVAVSELEQRYKVPTFWGLHICITGFEDPEQRKEMESLIQHHGGNYRGDLRKDCTHLICFSPAGAKYSSAKAWGIHTVSIEWLSQSIQRGMILDEDYFKPTMDPSQRGQGAWLRKPLTRVESLKRTSSTGQMGRSRKLRRTASTQFENAGVWGDIVKGAPSPALGPKDSFMSAPETEPESESEPNGPNHQRFASNRLRSKRPLNRSRTMSDGQSESDRAISKSTEQGSSGIFHDKLFYIHGFDERRVKLLESHLRAQNGEILTSSSQMQQNVQSLAESKNFIVMPHTATQIDAEELKMGLDSFVTELWLEKCLHEKQFVSPHNRPFFRPFRHPVEGFAELTISSTGFEGVDLMHLSKVVKLLGASYHEGLTPSTSLLLCNSHTLVRSKIKHALEWKVPALDVRWLWDCIKYGQRQKIDDYIIHHELRVEQAGYHDNSVKSNQLKKSENSRRLLGRSLGGLQSATRPPDLVVKDSFTVQVEGNDPDMSALQGRQLADDSAWNASVSISKPAPLQEVSSNLSRRPSILSHKKLEMAFPERQTAPAPDLTHALTSLLTKVPSQKQSPQRRTRRLFGRATSDLSTRSLGSRAESVDSMNTDGLGTPLEPVFKNSPAKSRQVSRPVSRLAEDESVTVTASTDDTAPAEFLTTELLLTHDELEEQERRRLEEESDAAPFAMTQVGYDDSEASVWRERLSRKIAGRGSGVLDDGGGGGGGRGEPSLSPGEAERELAEGAAARRRQQHVLKDEGRAQNISTRTRRNVGS